MSRKREWSLRVVFASGAAVLAYEIVGARLLSPVFGATLPVWSSIFAVTLVSLSIGYALGGIIADRIPPGHVLGASLGGAGIWMTGVPWFRHMLLMSAMGWGVSLGALGAAALFLGPPLILLGMTGPLVLRIRAKNKSHIGRDTGGVSSISTWGSVLGALVAGYWLIPTWDGLLVTVGLAAFVCALAAFVWAKAARPGLAAVFGVLALAGPAAFSSRSQQSYGRVLERAESFYGSLRVMDHHSWGKRIMYIDGIANTVVDIETKQSTSDYVSGIELVVFKRPPERMANALLIGLGGGSIVGRLKRNYNIKTDAVEIDETVSRLAAKWFAFQPSGEIFIEDARTLLRRSEKHYDLVIGDAFSGDTHPAHLFTVEAFRDVKQRLVPEGIFVINLIGYVSGPRAGLKRAVARTLLSVFKNVYAIPANQQVDAEKAPMNIIFYASDGPLEFVRDPVADSRQDLAWYYHAVSKKQIDLEADRGVIITDARNPVNRLNASVFLGIRKRIFETRGRLLLD